MTTCRLVAETEVYVDAAAARGQTTDYPGSNGAAGRRGQIVRVGAVAARSDHSHAMIAHPAIEAVCVT